MVRKATACDISHIARLAHSLWPHADQEDLETEFRDYLKNSQCALFLCFRQDIPVGFAQCQLRHDYVEGCETTPVGFLEGVYVDPAYHRKGVARQLVAACEDWARSLGCSEFGSDCEIDNAESLAFHLAIGFEEAGRTIWFNKKL